MQMTGRSCLGAFNTVQIVEFESGVIDTSFALSAGGSIPENGFETGKLEAAGSRNAFRGSHLNICWFFRERHNRDRVIGQFMEISKGHDFGGRFDAILKTNTKSSR